MIRAAFLRRMASVALASLLFEVKIPDLEWEPEVMAMTDIDAMWKKIHHDVMLRWSEHKNPASWTTYYEQDPTRWDA